MIVACSNPSCVAKSGASRRGGTGSLDLLVSFTILMTMMTAVTPLVVRYHRTVKSHRDYRLALDELSNQMERLIVLPAEKLPAAVKQLAPSKFVQERLAEPQLTGEIQPADGGTRITLRMTWADTERDRAPLTLVGWVFAVPPATGPAAAQTGTP